MMCEELRALTSIYLTELIKLIRISTVRLLYNRHFKPNGRAIVTLGTYKAAESFAELARQSTVGGEPLHAKVITTREAAEILLPMIGGSDRPVGFFNAMHLRSSLASVLLNEGTFSGRLVHMRGLPQRCNAGRIARLLEKGAYALDRPGGLAAWNRYLDASQRAKREASNKQRCVDVDGTEGDRHLATSGKTGLVRPVMEVPRSHQDSATRSFLIRFKTESEAHRFVRRWHRIPFDPERFGATYTVDTCILH
ncbi:hypothetical protein K437DRAFT_126973 [Tilletiaria anomala UBC 951]|uniref:Uncharacterized protein n=1 Tax=Tilletiaria anomala (strain ATCC 24038 / CBS 436.72 / UBC 951) TaxID=1037660 RepID=A0A066W2C6_TILAU|nr:uncharacterized protein K437DRAFT_126973 [Tilletiaria anomala UBC 951]KDN44925.1 hypothetical protein K437DRAFT_126973 [Tilletiaria anomala UBC 951]